MIPIEPAGSQYHSTSPPRSSWTRRGVLVAAAGTLLITSCGRGQDAPEQPTAAAVTWPGGSGRLLPAEQPIGLAVIYTGGSDLRLDWLQKSLQTGGVSTLLCRPESVASAGASAGPSASPAAGSPPTDTVLHDAIAYARSLGEPSMPVGVIAIGPHAGEAWRTVASGNGLAGAVMISVPGVANLDFSAARNVAVLAMHAVSDESVVTTHARTHTALAVVGVPHEMIEYGSVEPAFSDPASPDWAEATAKDAARRTLAWLRTAFTTGMRVQPSRSSDG